ATGEKGLPRAAPRRETVLSSSGIKSAGCLSPAEMAALVGEPANAPANERVWSHLAGCAECRELVSALVKVGSVADGAPERTHESLPPTERSAAASAASAASAPPRRGLAPGTILHDTYRIERLIGEGGMGSVHVATHLRLPKRV